MLRRPELDRRRADLKQEIKYLEAELDVLKRDLNSIEDELWDLDHPEQAARDYHRANQIADDNFFDEEYD